MRNRPRAPEQAKNETKIGYGVLGGGYHLPCEFEVLSGVRAQQLQQLVQKLSEKARQTSHVTRHKSHVPRHKSHDT